MTAEPLRASIGPPIPALLRYLLAGYVFLLPIQFEAPGAVRIALSDVFMFLFVICGLPHIRIIRSAWGIGHLGLLTMFLVGTFIAAWNTGSLSRYVLLNKDAGLAVLFVTFAIVTSAATDMTTVRWLLRLFLITATANTAVAIGALILSNSSGIHIPFFNYQGQRLSGLLIDPNAFGGFIALATIIHLVTFLSGMPLLGRWTSMVSAAVLVTGLVLTFSRSSWIGFTLAALSTVAFSPKVARRLALTMVVGAIMALLLVLRVELLDMERLARRPEQIQARIDQITYAQPLIAEHPVFGIGLGAFVDRHGFIIHNTSLWMLTEFGLIGLAVFVVFYGGFIRKGLAAHRIAEPADRPVIVGLLCGHVSMLGVSLGIEALYQRHWWFTMALLAVTYAQLRGRRYHSPVLGERVATSCPGY